MGWRYKAGLGLIGVVVLIWVTSAEITQKIFAEYKHPFVLTYLGISLMVPEGEMQSCLIADIDLNKTEEGWPFISENPEDEFHMLEENHKLSSWEVTKCGLYLAPIWFATEPLSTDNTL
ncbi:unnamed protein product [Ilex paraguariensis]|uniref:Uncharacterized protein n=1 Tax=Ilex paraguariensis TaxID=185542 RepID=A0ABC8THT4_9AQUA